MIAINRSVGTKIVIYSTVQDLSVLINFLDLWLTIQIEFVQVQIHGHHLMQIIVGYDSCNLKWCQITIINISEKPQPKRRAIKRMTNWEAFDRASMLIPNPIPTILTWSLPTLLEWNLRECQQLENTNSSLISRQCFFRTRLPTKI